METLILFLDLNTFLCKHEMRRKGTYGSINQYTPDGKNNNKKGNSLGHYVSNLEQIQECCACQTACLQEDHLKQENKPGSSKTKHKTSSKSSASDAHKAPGQFLGQEGPVDILGKRERRVRGKVQIQTQEFKPPIQYFLMVRSLGLKSVESHFPHLYK